MHSVKHLKQLFKNFFSFFVKISYFFAIFNDYPPFFLSKKPIVAQFRLKSLYIYAIFIKNRTFGPQNRLRLRPILAYKPSAKRPYFGCQPSFVPSHLGLQAPYYAPCSDLQTFRPPTIYQQTPHQTLLFRAASLQPHSPTLL